MAADDTREDVPLSWLARRPAFTAAAALIAGITLHPAAPDWPRLWLALSATTAITALLLLRLAPRPSTAALITALAALGLAVAQLEKFRFPADHVLAWTTDTPRLAELELTLDQPPRILTGDPTPGSRPLPPRQVTSGTVTRIKTWDGWRPATGEILLQLIPPNPDLAYGQRVSALGLLARPAPAMNPGQFDWARYYREQRILASLDVSHAENVHLLARGGFAPIEWLRQRARDALAKGFAEERSIDHALLRALLLGDSDPQLRDVQQDFQRTGTSHHLSISGMHVAVLGGVVFLLCRLARLSPRKAAGVMMAFVVLYGVVALPAPPVVRSIILCLCFAVGVCCRRAVDGVQLLAFTVCAMLLVHPLDLYNAGFQLSFLTVLGLMLYATRLAAFLDRTSEDERVLLSLGILPSRAASIRRWLRHHLTLAVAAGLVAWAVSAPLIVEHFDQLNPWAIPAGILLEFPVMAAMIGGLLKIVLTLLLPWLAPLWAWLAVWPVEAMRLGVAGLAKIPGSDLPLPALPVVLILAYYALLALPLIPTARRGVRWALRAGAGVACACALLLPLLLGFALRGGGELRVTLLYVGAGQCAVVETPDGRTILIDAGTSSPGDLARRTIEPFLRHRGASKVDAIFISHANLDHFNAVARLAEDRGVGEVLVTPQFHRDAAKNYPARAMLRRLAELKCPVKQVAAGQAIPLDGQCTLDVVWPDAGAAVDANNSSQVLRLTCRGRTLLFTGDVQGPAESALLADPTKLAADVLVAPHHGSAEETTGRFLEAVRAATILASDDRTPSGKQRAFDALVATQDRTLLRTHEHGAITVIVGRDGAVRVETFRRR
jgi:competence protein ComEC